MNTLEKQFSDALKREGKTITTYYTSESVKCLFRKNNDGNSKKEHLTIFYDISAPIKQGQLLSYSTKNYLVLNKESVENDTYYKSSLLECNLQIPVVINSVTRNIPCHSYELSSAYTVGNNVITLLDGKGEIITELINELSTTAYLGTGLNIMGGYYKVSNMYNLVGISHLMIERELKPTDVYALEITSETSGYKVGETTTLIANPTTNASPVTGQTFTYSSSDASLATVDNNGVVTFLAVGTVIITGKWTERNITDTLSLAISEADVPVSYTMTITANSDELVIGSSSAVTFTPTLKDGSGNVVSSWTAVWSFTYPLTNKQSQFTITYSGNNCLVKAKEDYDLIGEDLTLTCKTNDNVASTSFDILITSGW